MSDNSIIETKDTSPFYTSPHRVDEDKKSKLPNAAKRYTDVGPTETPRGLEDIRDADGNPVATNIGELPRSSNPYFNLRVKSSGSNNYPLFDEESRDQADLYANISAKDLVEQPKGASVYSADDFLYASQFGKMPLNRLITLRRFAFATNDDIFSQTSQPEPDICRAITYFDQEKNKLSDILTFSSGLKWKQLDSASERAEMLGDQNGIGGVVGKAMKVVDPKYGQESLAGANRVNYDPQHDSNRVYGPVDSISSASIREIGLKFEHNIELEFSYEMRSINGVNQKAAFIDLLSNLVLMSTNDAKFWGGARHWVGVQPSKYMNDMKALSPKNFNDFVKTSTTSMKSLLGTMSQKSSAKDTLKNIANNAMNLALGKMLNVLGRPGIPVMNSLLTGNPIGPWHVTIGNPMNPILVAGDLIMDDSTISFGDKIGYDDFPTELKLVVKMKHAKPRDRAAIESMFNAGKGRTYMKPTNVFDNQTRDQLNSSSTNPSVLTELQTQMIQSTNWGDFGEADVLRNRDAVWSFLKKDA